MGGHTFACDGVHFEADLLAGMHNLFPCVGGVSAIGEHGPIQKLNHALFFWRRAIATQVLVIGNNNFGLGWRHCLCPHGISFRAQNHGSHSGCLQELSTAGFVLAVVHWFLLMPYVGWPRNTGRISVEQST